MFIFNSLFTVILLVVIGIVFQKTKFFGDGFLQGINRLNYWVALPCMVFAEASSSKPLIRETGNVLAVILIAMLGGIIISYIVAWSLRLPQGSKGTFVQAAFRSNPAYVGFPIVVFAFSQCADGKNATALASLVLAAMLPFTNAFSVAILVTDSHHHEKKSIGYILKQIAINPILLGSLLGVIFSFAKLQLPTFLFQTLSATGKMALPLSLFAIGASLVTTKIKGNIRWAVIASCIRVALVPFFAYFLATHLGLSPVEKKIAVIYMASPTAAASYVMAVKLKGNEALAASAVFLSTILSAFSLFIALYATA